MQTKTIDFLSLFIAGFLLFMLGQGQEVISFESRFYVFALEMWKNGLSWFPTTYNNPYPDYPATSTILIYFFGKMFGGITRTVALIPTALAAALTLGVTYLIGALYSRNWGLASALFLLLTYSFVIEARTISLDQWVACVSALTFYVLTASVVNKNAQQAWLVFPLFIIGFLFRGPLGFVVPAGIMFIYFLLDKNFKKCFAWGAIAFVLLAICTGLWLWIASHVGGDALLQEVLQKEVLGRLHEGAKNPPFYFYFIESFGAYAVTYPLAILILVGLIFRLNFSVSTQLIKKLVGWSLIVLIGLSIPADKKVRYVLPMAPALALICGYLFMIAREKNYLSMLKKSFLFMCGVLPLVSIFLLIWVRYQHPELELYFKSTIISLIAISILMLVVHKRAFFIMSFAVLSFWVLLVGVVEPINVQLNKTSDFVQRVEAIRLQHRAELIFYHQGHDGLVIKYLANLPQQVLPVFLKTEPELKTLKKKQMIIASEEDYQLLSKKIRQRFEIIAQGRLGREPMVVLLRK